MKHRDIVFVAALAFTCANARADIMESFETFSPGSFPGGIWRDIGTVASPTPDIPTGQVIDTIGPSGAATRAFQVFQRRSASQGIIADIDPASHHRVSADLRVDIHPTPVRFANWTSAMGFFQETTPAADINNQPQTVVYVYDRKWYFYGATSPAASINLKLSDLVVLAGVWYNATLEADTATGSCRVVVSGFGGTVLLDRVVSIPGFNPDFGRYNRVAVFDGEYAPSAATPGQFSADNIAYVPAPGSISAILVMAGAWPRRRR